MQFAMAHNIDAFIGVADASDSATATAGAGSNDTPVAGLVIDRAALSNPLSASFALRYKAVLGAGNTVSFAATVQTASANPLTAPVTLATFPVTVADTGQTGGSTQRGVVRFPVDFAGAQEFVQITVTPVLSAAGTDTVEFSTVAVLGGQDFLPA